MQDDDIYAVDATLEVINELERWLKDRPPHPAHVGVLELKRKLIQLRLKHVAEAY